MQCVISKYQDGYFAFQRVRNTEIQYRSAGMGGKKNRGPHEHPNTVEGTNA
jgi:hypothetical protein